MSCAETRVRTRSPFLTVIVFTPSTGAPVWRRMIVNASASVPAAAGVTAVVVGDSAPS